MRRILSVIAALAVCCSALAADVGGIPANPRFNTITVTQETNEIFMAPRVGTSWVQLRMANPGLSIVGALCLNFAAAQCLPNDKTGDIDLYAPIGGGQVRVNGNFTSFAEINTVNSACSVSAAYSSANVAGCSWVSSGRYSISFTTGYVKDAVCTATIQNNGSPTANEIVELNGGPTTVGAAVYVGGVLGDGADFMLICNGS